MNKIKVFYENGRVSVFNGETRTWYRMNKEYFEKNISNNETEFIEKLFLGDRPETSNSGDIKTVYFTITRKCNLACSFCSMKSNPNVDTSNEITYNEFKSNILPKLIAIKPRNIVISGGEPIIKDRFFDIIDLLSKKMTNSSIALQTNGLLLDKSTIENLAGKITYVEISIENVVESQNLRNKMNKIFEDLVHNGIPMQFSYVVDKENKKNVINALNIAKQYNANILLRWVSPIGSALNNDTMYLDEKDVLEIFVNIIDDILEKQIKDSNLIDLILKPLQYNNSCGAYGRMISIYPNGEIAMCNGLHSNEHFVLGNILDLSVTQIKEKLQVKMQDASVYSKLLVDSMEMCNGCDIKGFCSGICASKNENSNDEKILKVDCLLRVILVKFWLFDYTNNEDELANLKFLRNRIVKELDVL